MRNEEDFNKLSFRRLLLVMVFISILISLIPNIFNFEKYYGLSRFVDQGVINAYLDNKFELYLTCLLYTSPSPRDGLLSRMPSSA